MSSSATGWPSLAAIPQCNTLNGFCSLSIKGYETRALIDSGSTSCSFISKALAEHLKLTILPANGEVSMANPSLSTKLEGECLIDFCLKKRKYKQVKVYVLDYLCADIILGQDFMGKHDSVIFKFGGKEPPLQVCALTSMDITPPLFEHLSEDCKPIAIKSRKQTPSNAKFIAEETKKLLEDGIFEPSRSSWRAQVLVTSNETRSQTINRFTHLDAYPLPDSEEMVRNISEYSYFSTFDLKSAYHHVPIRPEDKIYTAFEVDGRLYQFTCMPFRVTNGVAVFQRNINNIVDKENLDTTFPFLDNVTVCGHNKEELLANENKFRENGEI